MKKTIVTLAATVGIATLGTLSAPADDLEALSGKWVVQRTDGEGRTVKQMLEIKKDKFTFKVMREDQVALYAEGEVKTEQLGPFKAAKFYKIQGGPSASDLQPVEDDRTVIYTVADNELTVAANFDKERSEPANVDKYKKAAASDETKTLVIDKIVMHTTPQTAEWYFCFEATVGDATKRFNIPNKTYEKDEVNIPTELAIANVRQNQTCKFVMKLDDVAGDECSDEMDDKSTGSFTVTESGSQDFKPEDHWRYTIYWHLK